MSNTTFLDSKGIPIPNCIWCGANKELLVEREGRYGQFFYCPECGNVFNRNQLHDKIDDGIHNSTDLEMGIEFGDR